VQPRLRLAVPGENGTKQERLVRQSLIWSGFVDACDLEQRNVLDAVRNVVCGSTQKSRQQGRPKTVLLFHHRVHQRHHLPGRVIAGKA
jgi:hypothetical protein